MISEVDAHLEQLLETARVIVSGERPTVILGEHLADQVLELHEHLRKGGPLPARWTTKADGSNRS